MKTYLVEIYNPEIEFEEGSCIIALTPLVCYQLDKAGIRYSIIEDYYDAFKLLNQMEEYRLSVFRWIDDFDEFLRKNIKGLDLKLATIYRWYIKGRIIDPIYLRCYTLLRLFEAVQPTSVTYIARRPAESNFNYAFDNYDRSLYADIIPIICREKKIALTTAFQETKAEEDKDSKLSYDKESLITKLKKELYNSTFTRRLYFIYRYLKKLSNISKARRNKQNFFLLTTTHIGEDFIAEALNREHRVFLLSENTILKYTWFGTRRYKKLDPKQLHLQEIRWEQTADLLAGHDLVKWVNEKCELDVSELVLPRLRHFLLSVCPDLVGYIRVFGEFYKKGKINILFTPSISTPKEYAALAATKSYPQLETACLIHGDGVYDERVLDITDIQNYNILISSNTEMKEHLKNLAGEMQYPVKVFSNSHRLQKIQKIAHVREKQGYKVIRKNRIIYLPTMMLWDARRNEGEAYSDTWYYEFQKSLLEYLATKGEFTFIWKGLLHKEWTYDPRRDFINDNNFSNIEIAMNPFIEHLLTADRVICDFPSTGFYESIFTGIPTMSLYHRTLKMRKAAVAYFGTLLKPFTDVQEAIKHVDDFLNGNPNDYMMKIDTEEGSLFNIFERTDELV